MKNPRELRSQAEITIVDDFTKEPIDIVVDHEISGQYVTRVLDQAGQFHKLPKVIRTAKSPI